MSSFHVAMLVLLIGFVAGLRTMTSPAIVSWAACLGWLNLRASKLAFLGSLLAVIFLSMAAIGEFIADRLPRTGNRTALGPLIARSISGGLCGAALSTAANQSVSMGIALGVIGALIGSFAGYHARVGLVRRLAVADALIAIPEDLVALGLAILAVSRL
jgi:uncharacterized membrane protein